MRIVGFYDAKDWRIKGLVSLCNLLGVSCLNGYNMLSFKFDGVSTFSVCAFDSSLIEAPLTPHPTDSYGSVGNDVTFQILVKPFHMKPYFHGVDISAEFKDLRQAWKKTDFVTVYVSNRCWYLEIRK